MYVCNRCDEQHHCKDEVVFDDNELKSVDEQNPDWSKVTCNDCFYGEVDEN